MTKTIDEILINRVCDKFCKENDICGIEYCNDLKFLKQEIEEFYREKVIKNYCCGDCNIRNYEDNCLENHIKKLFNGGK